MRGRLRALRARGGKLVVIDPRRSRTAEEADEHHFIRPGTDAHLLFALVQRAVRRGPGRARRAAGRDHRRASTRPRAALRRSRPRPCRRRAASTPTRSAAWPASWPRRPRAAVYGRIGTCTQEFGTLASWLVDVLNVLTGNLDREGGAMFPLRRRRPLQRRRRPGPRPRRAASGAGTAASAGWPRSSASCRWPASPRRSRPPARARSAR